MLRHSKPLGMSDIDPTHQIAIVGGGPAGLMAAEVLAKAGKRAIIYDRMPSLGRKLLMAGRGGLNLTHSEALETFLTRYGASSEWLAPVIRAFPPDAVRAWADGLGAETFVGSSGRVFPKRMKASPLLRAWLARLGELGVEVRLRHRWIGFGANGALRFETPAGPVEHRHDAAILAVGGASWPRLGSDGGFADVLARDGIAITPLAPANMGFEVAWSEVFRGRFPGQPLKRIRIAMGDHALMGEAMISARGIEGGAIYALSDRLREAVAREGTAQVTIDLRPDLSPINSPPNSPRRARRRACRTGCGRPPASRRPRSVSCAKPIAIWGLSPSHLPPRSRRYRSHSDNPSASSARSRRPVASAKTQFDDRLMLKQRPGVFLAGEMLDWEAPTGRLSAAGVFRDGGCGGGRGDGVAGVRLWRPARNL